MGNPFAAETELLILRMLKDEPEGMYGLELVRESNGKLKRGTVYVTLGRLEEKGFLRSYRPSNERHPGIPRPRYSLTGLGQRALEAADLMGLQVARA